MLVRPLSCVWLFIYSLYSVALVKPRYNMPNKLIWFDLINECSPFPGTFFWSWSVDLAHAVCAQHGKKQENRVILILNA